MLTSTLTLTRRIYTADALQQTIEAFANLCTASFTSEEDAHLLCLTAPRPLVREEFLNYALALSAEELLR
jgi:hypothetical protein